MNFKKNFYLIKLSYIVQQIKLFNFFPNILNLKKFLLHIYKLIIKKLIKKAM